MDGLQHEYQNGLMAYLQRGGESELKQGYECGRHALSQGRGILDMISIHEQMLEKMVNENCSPSVLKRANEFFAESMSPFEMTHRAFGEANATLRRLNEALEGEARKIARALHDESGQLLAAVHIQLQELSREIPTARPRISEAEDLLDQIEQQLRQFSHELRPTILDDYGLPAAIQSLADKFSRRFGLPVKVNSEMDSQRMAARVEAAMYRVAQEALNNVAKHAQASKVTIRLWQTPGAFHCRIRDDGVGFKPGAFKSSDSDRAGLLGIRERLSALGGTLQIDSAPKKGTELKILVPLED